jgi:hypothetical protein
MSTSALHRQALIPSRVGRGQRAPLRARSDIIACTEAGTP